MQLTLHVRNHKALWEQHEPAVVGNLSVNDHLGAGDLTPDSVVKPRSRVKCATQRLEDRFGLVVVIGSRKDSDM